jgi:hypothetical protein
VELVHSYNSWPPRHDCYICCRWNLETGVLIFQGFPFKYGDTVTKHLGTVTAFNCEALNSGTSKIGSAKGVSDDSPHRPLNQQLSSDHWDPAGANGPVCQSPRGPSLSRLQINCATAIIGIRRQPLTSRIRRGGGALTTACGGLP